MYIIGRLVKWYNSGLQNRCRGFDSSISRPKSEVFICQTNRIIYLPHKHSSACGKNGFFREGFPNFHNKKTPLRALFYFLVSLKATRFRSFLLYFLSSIFRSTFFLFLEVQYTSPLSLFLNGINLSCDDIMFILDRTYVFGKFLC